MNITAVLTRGETPTRLARGVKARDLTPADENLLGFFHIVLHTVFGADDLIEEWKGYKPHPDPNDWSLRKDPKPNHE